MTLISIIIPVYNCSKYINKCIDSIINQKGVDYEILLIDDGSTDSSGNICDLYAKKHKNIMVYHKENEGVSATRNTELDNCHGDYSLTPESNSGKVSNSSRDIISYFTCLHNRSIKMLPKQSPSTSKLILTH